MNLFELVIFILAIILTLALLYFERGTRRKPTPAVVIIEEGRFPGEAKDAMVCPRCGRRFKHTITVEDELVKCPFCGNEIS